MYNAILLNKCNLRCSYCFADDYMYVETPASPETAAMTEETFDHVVALLRSSGIDHVSLMGGEPTLHPEFRRLWSKAHALRFNFSLKSNATWDADMLAFLNEESSDDFHSFHLNVNGPERLTPSQWQTVRSNVISLRSRRKSLQFNLEGPRFEHQWILDLALEANIKHIFWTPTAPAVRTEGGQGNHSSDYNLFKREGHTDLLRFLRACAEAGIKTHGIHGPTPCLLAADEYEQLKKMGANIDGRCYPVYDFFPDGTIKYCFAMPPTLPRPLNLSNVKDLREVTASYMNDVFALRAASFPWQECVLCPEALEGRCHGGCMAQRSPSAQKARAADQHFFELVPLVNTQSIFQKPKKVAPFVALLAKIDGNKNLEEIFRELHANDEAQREMFKSWVVQAVGEGLVYARPLVIL